jgi:hypothetical protein
MYRKRSSHWYSPYRTFAKYITDIEYVDNSVQIVGIAGGFPESILKYDQSANNVKQIR